MYDFQMMSRDSLDQIAQGMSPRMDGLTVETGALPPQPVARRIVAALANGTLPEWCMSYMVIERDTRRVLACCNFKGNPVHRSVEIGYGVSSLHWGKGVGTAAAMFLVDMATQVPQLITQVIDLPIPRQRKMTLHGGSGGFWQLQGLEQVELFRGGSADAGIGLVADGGAVLLDAPELLQCLGRARRVPGSL